MLQHIFQDQTKEFKVQDEEMTNDFVLCLTVSLNESLIYRPQDKDEDLKLSFILYANIF